MNMIFAAAAAALALAQPTHANTGLSLGLQPAQECAAAAGNAAITDRQMREAIATCNIALQGNVSHTTLAATLVNRGLLQAAAHDDSAAVADFTAALAVNDRLAPAYISRGTALLRAGQYDKARADFDSAIALNPANLHVAYFNRGEAQEAMGNNTAAYHDYRKAQELSPNFQPAMVELARFSVAPRRLAANPG